MNGAAAARLGTLFSGKPKTPAFLTNNYDELLNWVSDQPWFKAPEPQNPKDREWKTWNCCAALLDAFVYEEING